MSGNKNIIIITAIVGLILLLAGGALSQSGGLDNAIQTNSANSVIFADQKNPVPNQASGEDVPKILFPEIKYDFGKVAQQSKLNHIFKVRNAGTAPLKIIKAKGS